MKNRFYFDGPLAAGSVVTLSDEERHHARVLRVREGEDVEVFDGRGAVYAAIFDSADAIRLGSEIPSRESRVAIHLAMAVIQIEKFELVLQKATELGVASIIPLITERCEIRPERYRGKSERWEKIIFEATKQSGRSRVPALEVTVPFEQLIKRPGSKILFDADENATSGAVESPMTVLIGPEGGWSENELVAAREAGCEFRRLGPRRLRAETAAIVGVAILTAQSGDI